ncbi:MAG TPA: S-methyl-5'-thioadenosine phosphorylase [Polyangia bacterium]
MILGVLGGSGLYDLDGLSEARTEEVSTPFGPPSAPVASGRIGSTKLLFLPRHGQGHRYSPSEINYRANVFALKSLGAEKILSVSAVGSLREGLTPGEFVLPDQFIDKTWGRASTFFGGGVVGHVGFAEPTCPSFAAAVAAAGAASGRRVHRGGTYVCMEGPQFSTRAESQLHRSWGADVIGMTAATEAKLCREAEVCFASLALVTDYDAWHASEAAVSVEAIVAVLRANVAGAQEVIRRLGDHLPGVPACGCARAAAHAVITAPDAISAEARGRLRLLLGRDP